MTVSSMAKVERAALRRRLQVRGPTTWTIFQQDGSNHLGLWQNVITEQASSASAPAGDSWSSRVRESQGSRSDLRLLSEQMSAAAAAAARAESEAATQTLAAAASAGGCDASVGPWGWIPMERRVNSGGLAAAAGGGKNWRAKVQVRALWPPTAATLHPSTRDPAAVSPPRDFVVAHQQPRCKVAMQSGGGEPPGTTRASPLPLAERPGRAGKALRTRF